MENKVKVWTQTKDERHWIMEKFSVEPPNLLWVHRQHR